MQVGLNSPGFVGRDSKALIPAYLKIPFYAGRSFLLMLLHPLD